MFCPNCGKNLASTATFCDNCGSKLNANETMTDALSKQSKNFINNVSSKLKSFITKYKKQVIIISSMCLIVFLSIFLFNKFYDFTKINWVKDFGDIDIEYTSSTKLMLKAEAFDKEEKEIKNIKYTTKDGKVEIKEEIAYWSLPTKEGTYTIYAEAPSGKKIKKEVSVVNISEDSDTKFLGGLLEEDVDENTDSDKDTIPDKKEEELGTNPYSLDSDGDGLPDNYEIDESKTDPLIKDTDKDGLNDGAEVDLSLDPLKEDSKGDGIKDGNRSVSYIIDNSELGINIEITGKGNIPQTTIDVFKNSTFTDMDGLLDTIYNFYTEGTIENAVVKIKYDLAEIQAKGLNEDNLTFYYFNEETKELETMPTIVDKENKILTITLSHFSKYLIGDKNVVLTNNKTQIMAVIDNSVSMYTYEQLSNAGYTDITGADGNDSEFKRLTLTNNLVDMFTGNYEFGVAEFSGNYVNLKEFTSDKKSIKKAVNSMNTNFNSNASGTNIITALNSGINEFSNDENSHYLVLLTDGKNTVGNLSSSKDTIISNAKEKNIKVCVIGLGQDIDTDDLNSIAEETGCDYYHASDAQALEEIYSIVGADINYNLVDTDNDGKTDGTIIADSGFITSRDGFYYQNPGTVAQSTGGICYGIATFANLRYRNILPTSLDEKHINEFYSLRVGNIDWYSSGFDLKDTYFSENKNFYDYRIQDDAIRLRVFEFPEDIRDKVKDEVYYVSDKYYDMFANIGITYELQKYKGDIKGIKKYQSVGYLDLENELFEQNGNYEDVQLLKAFWRLFMLQAHDEEVTFSGNNDNAYNKLINELNSKNPIVIGIGGNHAVNAVRLIQENNEADKFKLEIYDNNHPGERQYIEVTRSKLSNIVKDWWHGDFDSEYVYSFTYEDYGKNNIDVKLKTPIIK